MRTATTTEFRNVVRKYAKKKGLAIWGSWTNGSRSSISCQRTVGFSMPDATPALAVKIEKKLNKKGLTAETRYTGGDSPAPYIRGTCVLA